MKKFIVALTMVLVFIIHPVFAESETGHKTEQSANYTNITETGDTIELIQSVKTTGGETVSKKLFIGDLIFSVLLIALVVFLLLRIRTIKSKIGELTDSENYSNEIAEIFEDESEITERILRAFEKNEFKMYLQFVVDNKTKAIVSCEALSRWESHDKGLIGPYKYIGILESTGLISKHDFYMFELVCGQLEKWSNTEYKDISISCNFTRITLSEKDFIDKLKAISDAYSFDKSKLSIEITEDDIEKDRETAARNIKKCKEIGFTVYLDDLGSGYTALANLCDYSIDIVKIDRDILLKADTQKGKDLFCGIIALAHSLNIKVICEGVETEEQNILVSGSDCDYIQGWYYSKPLPLEESVTFIEGYNINL